MELAELRGHRHRADRAFHLVAIGAAALVLLILGLIATAIVQRSMKRSRGT